MANKRHEVESREEFTDSQKFMIAQKSDNCCAWCGKKVYFGYGGTVDHFIPLKKGGTNDGVNLVLMCKDCNEKKGSMIIPVNVAGYYVKEPYSSQLGKYFDDYVHSFDYVSRGNLICCDIYELFVMPESFANMRSKQRRKGKKFEYEYKKSRYLLCRAYPNDIEKITQAYIKYLKKYNLLHSEEAALENIKFWMRFGTIYYIEKSGEVSVISTMTVNKHGYLSINLFSYYSTTLAQTLAHGIVDCISQAIVSENDLAYLPISVNMIKEDTLNAKLLKSKNNYITVDGRLDCVPFFIFNPSLPKEFEARKAAVHEGREKLAKFLHNFSDVEDAIRIYLHEGDLWDYEWMADEILERDLFDGDPVRNIF